MAIDEQIALTLYNRIYQVIGAAPGTGMPAAFDSDTHRFVMAQRAMVLDEADFRNPWSPGNPTGSAETAFNIAMLADQVMADHPSFNPTGVLVSDTYSKMLRGVNVVEPTPDPDIERKRDELNALLIEDGKDDEGRDVKRPTVLADNEKKAADAYATAISTYQAQFFAAQADELQKQMWPVTGIQLRERPARAYADWGAAGRDQVASTKAQLAVLNDGQVARSFADARFRLAGYELLSGLGETFYRTTINPGDWATEGAAWPEYTFTSTTLDSSYSADATTWGASANVQYGLWSFGGDVSHADSREAMAEDTSDIGLSFKWQVCPIYRKWMDFSLFGLPNWDVGGLATQGRLAGTPESMMPLIPMALVLVKDIHIRANFGHRDSEAITNATSGSAEVGWGPFSVSGSYSYNSTEKKFHASDTGGGFLMEPIQVLGYFCLRPPACPPR